MKNVFIVRHCEAEGQAPDARLTAAGRQQAERLTGLLMDKNIDYIISSPYERAYRTIASLAAQLDIEIVTDNRLMERALCGHNDPNWREMLRKTYDDLELCYEGGESGRAAMSRAVSVVMEVLNSRYNNVVIVSHGNLISLVLKHFDERIGFAEWEALSNPDIYQLAFAETVPYIRRIWTA
ncbi:histidine phosphatase family protein [Paenibacillus sp. GCM10027626]|uniref:histidine phosphatase family protein n=1 Tax=Paenibacillus sp. GCM10027626 TaxID=3273411 RepID=UPI003640666D